jgi:hypothetical protein
MVILALRKKSESALPVFLLRLDVWRHAVYALPGFRCDVAV